MKILLAGVSAASLLMGLRAEAQSRPAPTAPGAAKAAASENGATLTEIVVTAQKRSERLNEVPMSVAAETGPKLAELGVTDASQLEKIVPGFTYQTSNFGLPIFGIRGISFFDTSAGASPAVSVYVDQAPLPLSVLARGASLDLERVEVLKGPQGTLFGQNATGGAINYIAAKPTDTPKAGGNISYGRFNDVDIDGYVSGPLSRTIRMRLAARTEQSDGWQYSTTRDDRNGKKNLLIGRLLVDWEATSALHFELNLNAWRDRSDVQAAQFVRYAPQTPNGYQPAIDAISAYGPVPQSARAADWDADLDLARDDRFGQVSLRSDWDIGDGVKVTSISSYINYTQDSPYDPDGTDIRNIQGHVQAKQEIFSQELRLAGSTSRFDWMFGGNYEHDKLLEQNPTRSFTTNSEIAGVVVSGFTLVNNQRVSTKAVFGSLDYHLTPTLTLQGSARYTDQNRTFTGCQYDSGAGDAALAVSIISSILTQMPQAIPPGGCTVLDAATFAPVGGTLRQPLNEDNVSWRFGANWKLNREVLVYANATKGYKAGSFSNIPLLFTSQLTPVTQESVVAYEAGFKATLLGGAMQANGAGFYYDYTNKQINGFVQIFPFGNFPALINVPKSSVRGAELTIDWKPVSALTVSGSGTYVDAKVDKSFTTFDPFSTLVDLKGETLPNTPKWQLSGDVKYQFTVSEGLDGYVGSTVSYRSASFAAFGQSPEFRLPGYALVDLRAGIQDHNGRWHAQIWGRNITNKYYLQGIAHVVDTVIRYSGFPATYGVTVGFSY